MYVHKIIITNLVKIGSTIGVEVLWQLSYVSGDLSSSQIPCKTTTYFTSVAMLHLEGCANSITNFFKTSKPFSCVWSSDQIHPCYHTACKIRNLVKNYI